MEAAQQSSGVQRPSSGRKLLTWVRGPGWFLVTRCFWVMNMRRMSKRLGDVDLHLADEGLQ